MKANVQMSKTLFLLCLDFVSVLPINHKGCTRTPWKPSANAVEMQCIHQEHCASSVKTLCKLHETPPRPLKERGCSNSLDPTRMPWL